MPNGLVDLPQVDFHLNWSGSNQSWHLGGGASLLVDGSPRASDSSPNRTGGLLRNTIDFSGGLDTIVRKRTFPGSSYWVRSNRFIKLPLTMLPPPPQKRKNTVPSNPNQ
ncbi:hypothetical protein MUK42_28862 [Musa troglodytarum]|uniref:Uncharacterized protein n=1 Tax=Musa troglodytarum TaxID=320322 RepID=A0A9E7KDN9_9LILI|nr:hypothetical protein MUK42_28862 [Musa troglodytarum]